MQREVIKWIQTLDLSFPVHNPRRDLMNGFVVAEILSRYDRNVSMHSFDTGSAIARRLDNWQQIKKILQRLKCTTVNDELIELVIQGRDGAARRILEELYMFLTKRKLHPTPADNGAVGAAASVGTVGASAKVAAASELPAFMRPTAAKLLRDENDATKERFANLTGKTDEARLRQQNEAALETHEVGLQAQKFQEPDRFKPKPRPPTTGATTTGGLDGTQSARSAGAGRRSSAAGSTSRTRQKLQAARQLAVRGIDDTILQTFQQRQEHEKEEQFKAQFDPNEDLATALSRVCVRPLNQAGLVEALDEFAASSNGDAPPEQHEHTLPTGSSPGHEVSATAAAAATGDYFCKFVEHRAVVPGEAKRLVWTALKDAAGNIAKHLQHRAEEATHLAYAMSFAFKRSVHVAGANPVDAEDADAALDLLAAIGHQWQKLDLDAPTATAAGVLVPALAEQISSAPTELLQRLGSTLGAFCNPRDVESFKRLINAVNAVAGPRDSTSVGPLFVASLLETVDAKLCLGLDDVLEYYSAAFIHSTSTVERGAALRLLRALAAFSPVRVEPFLPAIRNLTTDADWEVRLCGLHLATTLYTTNHAAANAAAAHGARTPSNVASPGARSSIAGDTNAGGDSPEAGSATPQGGGPSPKFLAEDDASDILVQCFDSLRETSSLVQRASLCAVAPRLDYDALPQLCDAFVERLLSLPQAALDDMLRGDGPVSAVPGRVLAAHVAGNVVTMWNAVAVACALVNVRQNRSTYEFLSVLEPLVAHADLASGEGRAVWFAVAEQSKHEVVDAVYNPASMRGVSEAQMQACARLAGSIAVRLYQELSGEDDEDLQQQQQQQQSQLDGSEDGTAEAYARKLQERAIDWMQAAL
mmetsp:Transcript_11402/g.35432  ORF Transcript_11402/g.35432 Transcript_11402/m.35432 type:complete len:873 (-) Transcript_11402:28-2646(-)